MKLKFFLSLAALGLACLSPALAEETVEYTIKLANSREYTQCQIVQANDEKTKFTGINKDGENVTMEVKTSDLVEKTQTAGPQEGAAPQQEEAPKGEAATVNDTVQDVNDQLISDYEQLKAEYKNIAKPSRSLESAFRSRSQRIESSIEKLHKAFKELSTQQETYAKTGTGPFEFKVVPHDKRFQYVKDAEAAYNAMLVDTGEKKKSRKVHGLDKFDVLYEKYQGIPQYKKAFENYIKTVKALEASWKKSLAKEEGERKKRQAAKRADMEANDTKEFDKIKAILEKDGENLATVWFNPPNRNVKMLNTAITKAADVIRRTANNTMDKNVGIVPELLNNFWADMDKACEQVALGQLEEAAETLKNSEAYKSMLPLSKNIFGDEYRSPLKEQYLLLDREIRSRTTERNKAKRNVDRALTALEREQKTISNEIEILYEYIERDREIEAAHEDSETLSKKDREKARQEAENENLEDDEEEEDEE